MSNQGSGVFVIYTGGTIGSLPKDESDPMSPLVTKNLEKVMNWMPNFNKDDSKIFISGQWIRLHTFSWEEPIDSSNITFSDWKKLALIIKKNYNEWEGFVVLHGTDTLAYTSSALAFMLDNLSKPVIVTGSQRPIGETRSDAIQNFVSAIELAAPVTMGNDVVPEVCVYFRDHLFRGCRTTKFSASSYNAFASPNIASLATAGEHIPVNKSLLRPTSAHTLTVNHTLEENIASLDVFPGMSTSLLKNMLGTENLRGVVLQTFGTGNAPTTQRFLGVIADAVKSGKVIVDVTQCRSGEVELGLYDVSAGLLSRGVVSGMDMTPEAALTKLAVVLGKCKDPKEAADMMQLNLKGEQRQSIFNLHYPAGAVGDEEKPPAGAEGDEEKPVVLNILRPIVEGTRYDSSKLDKAILRVMGLKLTGQRKGRIEFKIYMDLPGADENTSEESNHHYLGKCSKKYDEKLGEEGVFLQINQQVIDFVDPRHPKTLTLVGLGSPFEWSSISIALFVNY